VPKYANVSEIPTEKGVRFIIKDRSNSEAVNKEL
jgi:hypothetical protein